MVQLYEDDADNDAEESTVHYIRPRRHLGMATTVDCHPQPAGYFPKFRTHLLQAC